MFHFRFCLVLAMFCARLFICALWSPAGKGLTSWLSFVVSSVSLSLSHWYPGSGVVFDCIDSWSLQPYYFYRRKWAYRLKTAFPEPYPLQKRSLSAKNKLSDTQWHQKVSKIISSINYMKKRAMQWNNREAIRQKSNSHMFVDDADFL